MSASLVGSEMCIRDSCDPPRPPRSIMLALCVVAGAAGWAFLPSVACAPVSYTHLTLPTICSV
eukprot:10136691-Alexandrium_andersonii.AAC.1